MGNDLQQRAVLAGAVHLERHERSVVGYAPQVIVEVAVGMMLERRAQRTRHAADGDLLVHFVAHPARCTPVIEAYLPVGPGVAMAQEGAEVGGKPRYRPALGTDEVPGAQRFDLGAQRRRDQLVGVHAQHPVVKRRVGRELLLRSVAGPIALDHACTAGRGDLARRVARVRVDHQQLIAEGQRLETGADAVGLVAGDHAGREWSGHPSRLRAGLRASRARARPRRCHAPAR